MKIEEFKNVTMIYMRHVGEYGLKNKELMETFKQFLKDNHLLNDQSVLLLMKLKMIFCQADWLMMENMQYLKYLILLKVSRIFGFKFQSWQKIYQLMKRNQFLNAMLWTKSRIICVNSVFHLNNINCINKKDVLESIFSKIIQIIVKLCYNESVNKSS